MRYLIVVAMLATLTACGGSAEDKSVAACEKALKGKAQGKTYSVDLAKMKASAKSTTAGEVSIAGEVVFDVGLPREAKQRFECTTRVVEGKSEPDVISFSLVW